MPLDVFGDLAGTYVNATVSTTPVAGTSEVWTVISTATFPQIGTGGTQQFRCTVGPTTDTTPEIVICTQINSSTTMTVTRGAESSTIKTHAVNDPIMLTGTAAGFDNRYPAKDVSGGLTLGSAGGTYATNAGQIYLNGTSAGLVINDRTTNRNWQWYGSADIHRLYNGTSDVFSVDSSGNTTAVGRITTASDIYSSGAAIYIQPGSTGLIYLRTQPASQNNSLIGSAGAWTTYSATAVARNVLDDGAGNASLAGMLTVHNVTAAATAGWASYTKAVADVDNHEWGSVGNGYLGYVNRWSGGQGWAWWTATAGGQVASLDGSGNLALNGTVSSTRYTATAVSNTLPALTLENGNSGGAFVNPQIAFGYNGSATYESFIVTDHSSGNPAGNPNNGVFYIYSNAGSVRQTLDDGSGNMTVAGNVNVGGVVLPARNGTAWRARSTGTLTVAAGTTSAISYSVLDYGTTALSYATGVFTAPRAGVYRFTGWSYYVPPASNGAYQIVLGQYVPNGGALATVAELYRAVSPVSETANYTVDCQMGVGDTFYFAFYNSNGTGSTTIGASAAPYCGMTVVLISA
jgi:hypothetical protein